MPKIEVTGGTQQVPAACSKEQEYAIKDLIEVYKYKNMFINEKGYLQKLIELLYELGYYKDNKSIFGV